MTGVIAGGSNPMISGQTFQHKFGQDVRPSYAALFEKSADGRVAVMACGPPPLVADANPPLLRAAAKKHFCFDMWFVKTLSHYE